MQEMWVQFLGWEDSLKKEMASHSSILAWEIPWTEEPGRLQSIGVARVRHDWASKQPPCTDTHTLKYKYKHTYDSSIQILQLNYMLQNKGVKNSKNFLTNKKQH